MQTTWKINDGESRRVYLVNTQKGDAIGEIIYTDTRNPDNARLIAAAPDLLLLVGDLLQLHIAHHNEPTHARARKLINHIKGTQ
jgi:hypothetical protein